MLNEDLLRWAAREAQLPEAPVHYHVAIGSTNTEAMTLAFEGAPEWTLVAAGHQTTGRGRLGRTWVSEPGSSLLFSFVLRPRMEPERTPLLALLAGVAMADACRGAGKPVWCKWPNDLLLDEHKVGGVLTEASVAQGRIEHVVIGVGVNLETAPSDVLGAEGIGAGGLGGVDDAPLLTAFLAEFHRQYGGRSGRLVDDVVRRYRPLCTTLGRRVRARTVRGGQIEGVAEDLDASGNLLVRAGSSLETVLFGEVQHLNQKS